jgi:hypothetical protein
MTCGIATYASGPRAQPRRARGRHCEGVNAMQTNTTINPVRIEDATGLSDQLKSFLTGHGYRWIVPVEGLSVPLTGDAYNAFKSEFRVNEPA